MKKLAIAAALLALTSAAGAQADGYADPCGTYLEIAGDLTHEMEQRRVLMVTSVDGARVEIWGDEDGNWTAIEVVSEDEACVVAVGQREE